MERNLLPLLDNQNPDRAEGKRSIGDYNQDTRILGVVQRLRALMTLFPCEGNTHRPRREQCTIFVLPGPI